MNLKELRIGNYIYGEVEEDEFIELEVVALDSVDLTEHSIWYTELTNHSNDDDYNSLDPIPLTEEWLVRLGLEDGAIVANEYPIEITRNGFSEDKWWASIRTGYGSQPVTIVIESVHHLQNLYFVLTGEELEIKKI